MRRWLRILGIGLAGLLLLVLLAGAFLLRTTAGARLVLARVVPAEVELGGIDGSLWGPLVLEDVRYSGDAAEARIARLRVDWRPMRLLLRRAVEVTALDVDTVRVTLRETGQAEDADDEAGDGVEVRPSLPLAVRLEGVRGRAIRVLTANGDTVRVGGVALDGSARQDTFDLDTLQLRDLDVRGSRFRLDAGGRVVSGAATGRDTMGLDVTWSGRLADGTVLDGQGTVRGTDGALIVDHRLARPIAARTEAAIRRAWLPDSLRWEMTTEVPRFALSELRDGLAGELALTAEATGGLASVTTRVDARGTYPDVGEAAVELAAAYRGDTVTVDTLGLRRLDGPGSVRGAGRVVLAPGLAADVDLAWRSLSWPLDSPAIVSPDGTLEVTGRLEDFRTRATIALRQPDRPLGRWTVESAGGFADGRLTVDELVARSRGGARLSATADVTLEDGPGGSAELRWAGLAWPVDGDTTRIASPDGRLEVRGSLEELTIDGDLSVAGPAVPLAITRVQLEVVGTGSPDSLRARIDATGRAGDRPVLELLARGAYRTDSRIAVVDTLAARLPDSDGRLDLEGTADLNDLMRRLDVRARWSALAWPLDSARYRSDQGRLDVRSVDGRMTAAADLQLGGATLPAGQWRLAGQGDADRFVVDSIRGRLLDGEILATGVVRPDSSAWELEISGDSLAPDRWRPAWDGRLGFGIRTRGVLAGDGPRYRVTVDTVRGVLRDRPLAGYAALEGTGSRIRVDTVRLRLGESGLDAGGTIGDTLDVTGRLVAEELVAMVPGAVGRLTAEGRVTGTRDTPSVELEAHGRGITFAGWTADTLSARIDVPGGGRGRSSATVRLAGIGGPSAVMDSATLEAEGTRGDHTFALTVGAPRDVLEARATGGLTDGRWTGELGRLQLRSEAVGEWRLREPVPVAVGTDSGSVDGLCWVGSGELCAGATWGPDGARWQATGERLPTELLRPVLPQAVTPRGEFTLETRGRTAPGLVPTGTLRLTTRDGEVDYLPTTGPIVTQAYDSLGVDIVSDSSGIDARTELWLGPPGRLTAVATLPGTAPLADRTITGRLDAHLEDDGTVSRYIPALAESHGTADARIRVSGRVRAPEVEGEIELNGVGARVTTAGVRLSDGQLTARSTADGDWEIEGGALSDSSRLALTGSARPPSDENPWRVELRLDGSEIKVWDTPDLLIVASPDLDFRVSPDSVAVDGRITVPRARIAIEELEGNVDVSSDVVIVGAEGETPADSMVTPAAVRGEVLLILGDSVMLNALGLTGRLDGRLTIAALPGRPPVASGELIIHDGRYRIYRQTFDIDQGRLLYASTPLPNPALDLRITRSRGEVTAGMEVTGRARDPRVELFSEPAMDDEQVLAYLLVGRPLRRLDRSQGSRVESMARSLGVAGGNLLLARLGSTFGLETARIERSEPDQEGTRSTSLVLGTEILPRVEVDYAIGFGAAANVLRLRYRLTEHWILQTESGQETGADILYTFNTAGALPGPIAPPPESQPPR